MKIDENTRGSIANQEAVRLLTSWLSILFIVDWFVCMVWGCIEGAVRAAEKARRGSLTKGNAPEHQSPYPD
jgi:hypothetical protein